MGSKIEKLEKQIIFEEQQKCKETEQINNKLREAKTKIE